MTWLAKHVEIEILSMDNKQTVYVSAKKFLFKIVWQSDLPEVWPGPSSLDSHFGREQSKKKPRDTY